MTTPLANQPAFPHRCISGGIELFPSGLSKREMFAAMAMQGLLANEYVADVVASTDAGAVLARMAKKSVEYADALLVALEEKK